MTLPTTVSHAFVDLMPSEREEGIIYVSIKFSTAVHNCLCGCGMKVVTPIRRDKWVLTYDGEAISLSPSIGNWSFPCQSHYWIRNGQVIESGRMSREAIDNGRMRDADLTRRVRGGAPLPTPAAPQPKAPERKKGFWERLFGG